MRFAQLGLLKSAERSLVYRRTSGKPAEGWRVWSNVRCRARIKQWHLQRVELRYKRLFLRLWISGSQKLVGHFGARSEDYPLLFDTWNEEALGGLLDFNANDSGNSFVVLHLADSGVAQNKTGFTVRYFSKINTWCGINFISYWWCWTGGMLNAQ